MDEPMEVVVEHRVYGGGWEFVRAVPVKSYRKTPKRIYILEGIYRKEVFDLISGEEITTRQARSWSQYRHSIRPAKPTLYEAGSEAEADARPVS